MDSNFFLCLLFVVLSYSKATQASLATFHLYTPQNESTSEIISASNLGTTFNSTLKLTLIIHGYTQNGNEGWIKTMRKELMKRAKMNIIVVDWGRGSGFMYSTAVQNTPKVGSDIARLLHSLHKRHNYDVAKVHVIGHSLGAHVAGFAGAKIKGKMAGKNLGRITGLDPARPSFNHNNITKRLDPSDAKFVDVIHTDTGTGGLGLARPCGHVDFYPNGGDQQPGCVTSGYFSDFRLDSLLSNVLGIIGLDKKPKFPVLWQAVCDHMKVISFFTSSINNRCPRKAYECRSWQEFSELRCYKCQAAGACAVMGYDADQYYRGGIPRKYYLITKDSEPFCGVDFLVYHVTLKDIKVGIRLFGGYGEVQVFLIGKDRTAISTLPRSKVTYYMKEMNVTIVTTINPGELGSIMLRYAGNLRFYVGRVTVKGPKNNYSAFYGTALHSVHDYSTGQNRYRNYRARLRKDTVSSST